MPPLVKQNLQTLHMIIFHARNKPLEALPAAASLSSSFSAAAADTNETDYNENPLKCPLDLGSLTSVGEGAASCLVDRHMDRIVRKFKPVAPPTGRLIKAKPDLAVFAADRKLKGGVSSSAAAAGFAKSREGNVEPAPMVSFVSPFKRYQLLKPYLETIEQQEERARQQHQQQKQQETKPSDVDLRWA